MSECHIPLLLLHIGKAIQDIDVETIADALTKLGLVITVCASRRVLVNHGALSDLALLMPSTGQLSRSSTYVCLLLFSFYSTVCLLLY